MDERGENQGAPSALEEAVDILAELLSLEPQHCGCGYGPCTTTREAWDRARGFVALYAHKKEWWETFRRGHELAVARLDEWCAERAARSAPDALAVSTPKEGEHG